VKHSKALIAVMLLICLASTGSAQVTYSFGVDGDESFTNTGSSYSGAEFDITKDIRLLEINALNSVADGTMCSISNNDTNTVIHSESVQNNIIDLSDNEVVIDADTTIRIVCDSISGGDAVDNPPITYDRLTYNGYIYECSTDGLNCEGPDTGPYTYSIWELKVEEPNTPPVINSTSVSPDPPLIGESVSYSFQASDSDGTISSAELTVFKDGSQVYQDSQSFSSSSVSYTWSDVYVPQSSGDLDAKFTVTDDAGAESVEWVNRTLSETAPSSPTINIPNGGTFNDESIEYDIATFDDGDNNEGESLTVSLKEDGTQVDQVTTTEGNTVTGSYTTSGEGSHNFDVTVEESDGDISSASSTYSVDFISPTVDSTTVSPDPFDYQDSVDITVDASDNTGVSEVCVQVDKDGSNYVGQTCRSASSVTVSETFNDYFTVDETKSETLSPSFKRTSVS